MTETKEQWWGAFELDMGEAALWEIGPLHAAVQRNPHEWLVAQKTVEEDKDKLDWRFYRSETPLRAMEFETLSRFVFESEPQQLVALPALADRPVVSRPFTPFAVPGGQKTTIYVSTPLWFMLTGGSPAQTLFETPVYRPSDTWFGLSTQVGELCYASRTYGRLNLDNLADYAHRAITKVHIHNDAEEALLVERLNLPVPYLSIFQMSDSALYTESVTMVQTRGTSLTEFTIEGGPMPDSGGPAQLLAPPRQVPLAGMLIRAFSTLKIPGFG